VASCNSGLLSATLDHGIDDRVENREVPALVGFLWNGLRYRLQPDVLRLQVPQRCGRARVVGEKLIVPLGWLKRRRHEVLQPALNPAPVFACELTVAMTATSRTREALVLALPSAGHHAHVTCRPAHSAQ